MFELKGRTALITGSTQGIGFAIAKILSDYGAKVFVHGATSMKKSRRAAEKIADSIPICVDLLKSDAVKSVYDLTGDVDILVLNASVQYRTEWNKIRDEEFDAQIKLNLKTNLEFMQVYAEKMKERQWGRIITLGSVQQYRPHKDMAVYAASKCAQMSFVKNIGKQLAPYGVTVNNLTPGVIDTPRNEKALSDNSYNKQVLSGIPAGYIGIPEDIAGAALLLSSRAGRYITGADIVVDGGMSL